jgi:hypothetical protein
MHIAEVLLWQRIHDALGCCRQLPVPVPTFPQERAVVTKTCS